MKNLLFVIDRYKHNADHELILKMVEQNQRWKVKDCQISALDYFSFKEHSTHYDKHDWYVDNFIVRTTANEYQVFQRYQNPS